MKRLVINTIEKKSHINKEIYGHFSEHLGRCIYEGLYVGENSDIPNVNGMRTDVVEALKKIKIPVLRWPGGCFADEYHWKDGIGPKETRKKMINTHWGGVVEDNSFGTHEFMELCRQLGCETYVNMNVGSGSVQEMSEWVEYLTFKGVSPMADLRKKNGHEEPWDVNFIGVGNENWGCGGNMRPEHYANEYRRYSTYCRNYTDKKMYKIMGGPNVDDYNWTETTMKTIGKSGTYPADLISGISLHYYVHPGGWENKGSALDFDRNEYYETIRKAYYMDELITRHGDIINQYDPEKRIGLIVDEWGTWYRVEPGTNPGFLYQQNTMRDAIVAGVTLNIFNQHSDRVQMANIAQLVNVLQAVILTDGADMLLTPTYHVFDMYKDHQDAELLASYIENEVIGTETDKIPEISQSVSISEDGSLNITLVNASDDKDETIDVIPVEYNAKEVKASILTGEMHDHNDFTNKEKVKLADYTDFKIESNGHITVKLPAMSVVSLKVC
ncbi:alpha-N-arabinofuranosidase [Lachnospiraceae bacterium KH1T2]|nr:alpha-N-arabinofuranosidase [Lachnospiraceae bacterium KH1T2]